MFHYLNGTLWYPTRKKEGKTKKHKVTTKLLRKERKERKIVKQTNNSIPFVKIYFYGSLNVTLNVKWQLFKSLVKIFRGGKTPPLCPYCIFNYVSAY